MGCSQHPPGPCDSDSGSKVCRGVQVYACTAQAQGFRGGQVGGNTAVQRLRQSTNSSSSTHGERLKGKCRCVSVGLGQGFCIGASSVPKAVRCMQHSYNKMSQTQHTRPGQVQALEAASEL
jgi:hypothetical protein